MNKRFKILKYFCLFTFIFLLYKIGCLLFNINYKDAFYTLLTFIIFLIFWGLVVVYQDKADHKQE